MAEVLLEFTELVADEDGQRYLARACGDQMDGGVWQGWVEFIPLGPGEPVRSGRETTQPNREDTQYWASGLTRVFLEGSLRRALNPITRPVTREPAPPIFDAPAPPTRAAEPGTESVLNPFSVYRKGESLLRRQLAALSGWHLVNIITAYDLSRQDQAVLAAKEPVELIEIIIDAVRENSRVSR